MLQQAFIESARLYYDTGYTTIPLGLDVSGRPKRPLPSAWSSMPHNWDKISQAPWHNAKGLGIVLGPQSNNLAVIDIDDEEMAQEVIAICKHTRAIRTIRNRCHVYIREQEPSRPTIVPVEWRGKQIKIELKCMGAQVAAPPTPGYNHVGAPDREPILVKNIAEAWGKLAKHLNAITIVVNGEITSGYPKPWQPSVPVGERNKSVYIEAHKLREAGMDKQLALDIMQTRYHEHYAKGGMAWNEVLATIDSAYRKGRIHTNHGGGSSVLRDLFGYPFGFHD